MKDLNLLADTPDLQRIKEYLQENASDTLAEKINNGTPVTKDGKKLISRKDLKCFMHYASEEAKKLAEKGAQYACIEDETEESDNEQADCNDESLEDSLDEILTQEPEATVESESKPTEKTEQSPKLTCSPLYERYTEIQSQYPNSVIACRVGDFYEVFGDNAVEIANLLGFTLTGRDCGLEERVPMCGFPYHASDKYFEIISEKRSIAVAEISGVVRQIAKKQDTVAIDYDTGEIMTEEEMREFDGDIIEPKVIDESGSIYEQERKIADSFDKETIFRLHEILGDIFIVR